MADWFKFYNDGLDSVGMQHCLTEQPLCAGVWLVILSEASKNRSCGFPWNDQEDFRLLGYSRKINVSPPVFNQCVGLLRKIGYIKTENGVLEITGWNKMQSDYAKGLDKGYYGKKKTRKKLASNSEVSTTRREEKRVEDNKDISSGAEGKAFIESWCLNYKAKWGMDYKFGGGRDGKAVKQILKMGVLRIDLLEIAKKAWSISPPTFETRQAQTIHGFANYFNQINLLTTNGNAQITKPNPRNVGVAKFGISYGEAAKLKLAKQGMAGQVAETKNSPQPDPFGA